MNHAPPVEICYENMCFLITHNPTNATLHKFTEELKHYAVTTLVRVCDATYDKSVVENLGIRVLDWQFKDGAPPPDEIVYDWLDLLKTKFREEPGCCVAVHCETGLGRAPFIRQKRRGAFNTKQLLYLEQYRPKTRSRSRPCFRDSSVLCCIQ
ncbi:protein tyrosine phosphatase type IVA 2-like isoform X2 [Nannospalax galili]|uniref:protein tyrosine phosphatase type IVA 2-like isoform X2 n=1 Tax=Nannospalax galili TaxID=1026970 RepID=UPI0004ED3550|nr:protein tyrosine phosphatase type IVA 2-like isoform X2 [Nannospalax galili]